MSLLRRLGALRGLRWPAALDGVALRGAACALAAHPLPPPRAAPPPWCAPLWCALGGARGFAAMAAARPCVPPPPPAGSRGFGIKAPAKRSPVGGKMKLPSSFKERFKVTKNGHFMRMRVGKRHGAFSKSRPQRRRLRKKALVAPGRAAIMRKLGFKFAGSGR